MRPVAVVMFMCAAAGAVAQDERPVEQPEEPAVRIPVQQGERVEEVRVGGRVVMLKVTPPGGTPYYLVDTAVPRDALDDGTRVPMWAIFLFD
jgi:Protein of unknown function (DUF2782)